MSAPIHHTFAPLGDTRQRRLALRLSYVPWRYRRGPAAQRLRAHVEDLLGGKACLFSTGREALLAFLRTRGWAPGDEVIVQGYTCAVVPNAVAAAGLTPVYADVDAASLSLSVEDTERRVTPKTRAILCQHTFGIPAPLAALRALCDRKGLLLIEDCAHVLPDAKGPEGVGRTGDAVLLSFGRDKAVSGVTGGAIVTRRLLDPARIRAEEDAAADLSWWTVARLLEYPQIYAFARPLYGSGLGKAVLKAAALLRLLLPILTAAEKRGTMRTTLRRMPDACAALALEQLRRLGALNGQRRVLTAFYLREAQARGWTIDACLSPDLPLQKFPLFTRSAETIRASLRRQNIHLHDGWTGCVICPSTVCPSDLGYRDGEDPVAEEAGSRILCLPTHPTMTVFQAKRLVEALDPLLP